jgi:valyl-tRNA synthetase
MYWIVGIILGIIILFKLLMNFTISKNITARYFALKDIFGNDKDISTEKYLEMAGVFSQIVDVKNGKVTIEDINYQAELSIVEIDSQNPELEMLCKFCHGITVLVNLGSGISYEEASERAAKDMKSIKKDVNSVRKKGYSKVTYKSCVNFIAKYPSCLSGIYNL